jgi:hypothetical protein
MFKWAGEYSMHENLKTKRKCARLPLHLLTFYKLFIATVQEIVERRCYTATLVLLTSTACN